MDPNGGAAEREDARLIDNEKSTLHGPDAHARTTRRISRGGERQTKRRVGDDASWMRARYKVQTHVLRSSHVTFIRGGTFDGRAGRLALGLSY